jgi:hypothetical protein
MPDCPSRDVRRLLDAGHDSARSPIVGSTKIAVAVSDRVRVG